MTDNEKAATFIGWRQGEWCPDHHLCPTAYEDDHTARHLLRAPDMTDPRNYMKALREAARRGYHPRFTGYQDTQHDVDFWRIEFDVSKKTIDRRGPNDGVVMRTALAALYDAAA